MPTVDEIIHEWSQHAFACITDESSFKWMLGNTTLFTPCSAISLLSRGFKMLANNLKWWHKNH